MRLTSIIILLLIAGKLFGQDKIVRTNGDVITGYITVVENDEIKYRKTDDRTQPVYTIKKHLVDRIVYESGEVQKMSVPAEMVNTDKYNFRHRIQWVYTDVFVGRLMFAYEYLNESGFIGVRVPIGVGVSTQAFNYGSTGISAVTGVDLNIYPTTARGIAKYYFGPMLRVGYNSADLFEDSRNTFYSLLFNNGISVNILPQLNMSAYLGLGVKYTHYIDSFLYYDNYGNPLGKQSFNRLYPHAVFGFALGYNFLRK